MEFGQVLGELHGEAKRAIIARSNWLFMPSYHESQSMVIMEALSCGTPVIAYSMPTLKSIYTKGVYFIQDWQEWSDEAFSESKRFNWKDSAKEVIKVEDKYMDRLEII